MNKPKKFFAALIMLAFVLSLLVPFQALAAEGDIDETVCPYLYCVYYNSSGEQVDGNELSSGDYRVDVMLEGMETVSVFEYTAEYDPTVVTSLSTEAVLPDMSLGGIKDSEKEDGKNRVAFVLASEDERYTTLEKDNAVTVSTMQVTVNCGTSVIDFENYFTFVEDPDLTFIEADYEDGIDYSYVINTNEKTTYNIPNITADVTPKRAVSTITVSGKILIANDIDGRATKFGLRGVKIYAYDNDNNIIAETVSYAEGDDETLWGDYSLEVPLGTTHFMVGDPVENNDSIVNRPFTIVGDKDVANANVAVIMCDYNDSGNMDANDKASFNDIFKDSYSIYADFNNSGNMDANDKAFFNDIFNASKDIIVYTEELSF